LTTDPRFGTTDQETPVLPNNMPELLPDNVNCFDCPAVSVVEVGLSCMGVDEVPPLPLATKVMTALPLNVGLDKLVAVTVTVCGALMLLGAV
jgi:hypothetical protein